MYFSGTITSSRRNSITSSIATKVSDYQQVKRGTKTLSNIAEQKASYKAKTGSNNGTVTAIQQKLYDLGFTSQNVNGKYDSATFNNISYFQITNDLDVTGWVDDTTYSQIDQKCSISILNNEVPLVARISNIYPNMELKKGIIQVDVEGTVKCDKITVMLYSQYGLEDIEYINGNNGSCQFGIYFNGEYTFTLLAESYKGDYSETWLDFKVVDNSTVLSASGYFFLGLGDAVISSLSEAKELLSNIPESIKNLGVGVIFLAKAIRFDGEERKILWDLWTDTEKIDILFSNDLNENARMAGKFVGEIAIAVLATKGIEKGIALIKESAKTGKLSLLLNSLSNISLFNKGRVTFESITANMHKFAGKSVDEIADTLKAVGYDVSIEKSVHGKLSKATRVIVNNSSKQRNIAQILVSPGTQRHGDLPYVKISTTDMGIVKVVDGSKSLYVTDGLEKARIIFTGGD